MSKEKQKYELVSKIEVAFYRIIGPLALIKEFDSYKDIHNEANELFEIIVNWAMIFQKKQTLKFITKDELLDVYNRFEVIKDNYLFDSNIGNESELSDEITIWMWELMELRKEQIEVKL